MRNTGTGAVLEAAQSAAARTPGDAGASKVERIISRIEQEVGAERYARYFQHQTRVGVENGRLDITVPTGFMADLIGRRFGDSLRKVASAELGPGADGSTGTVKFRVDRGAFVQTSPMPQLSGAHELRAVRTSRQSAAPGALRYRLEDFVVGESNRLAYSAAERLADPAGPRSFSPLFIHGTCGLGKTHLLQGIAARWRERDSRAVVRYTTAEQFTNEYVTAVRGGKLDAFRKSYRGVDVLCIDDVHFLANKTSTQGELLHTFDAIDLDGARVALASDEHPRQIARLSAALVSRFMSGMVVRLDPPEPALRERIIAKLAERRGMRLDKTAVTCLAGELGGPPGATVRDLEGALTRVEALCRLLPETAGGSIIGIAQVRRALGLAEAGVAAGGRGPRRPVRIDTIRDEVCRLLRVDVTELMGRGRHARVVLARSVISHLTRALTTMSYPEIARAMGRPNHSTIVTACKRIQGQIERGENPDFGSGAGLGGASDVAPELQGLSLAALCDVLRAAVLRAAWGPAIAAAAAIEETTSAPNGSANGHNHGTGGGAAS